VSGQHRKPYQIPFKIKAASSLVVAAAFLGTVAAEAAAALPGTGTRSVYARPVTPAGGAQNEAVTGPDIESRPRTIPNVGSGAAEREDSEPAENSESAEKRGNAEKPGNAGVKEAKPERRSNQAERDEQNKSATEPKEPDRPEKVTAAQVIKLAKAQLGESENRSGKSKFNKWFMRDPRARRTAERDGGSPRGYRDAAWCSMFVSWIGSELGISDQVGFDAWTVKHAEWFKENDRWGHKPRPGAVTFFSWGGGEDIGDIEHVGFTIKDNGGGTIKTIEGNTENRVAIRKRDKSDVVGYGYPEYAK
jgi:hypothetical protein